MYGLTNSVPAIAPRNDGNAKRGRVAVEEDDAPDGAGSSKRGDPDVRGAGGVADEHGRVGAGELLRLEESEDLVGQVAALNGGFGAL